MIKLIPLCLFLLANLCVSAQEYKGSLVHNDGTSKEIFLLNPYSKSNYKEILYLHYGITHQLYAENFKRVQFSDDIVYSSIEINPKKKVWARLHFESEIIKLYLRYNSLYIEVENKIYDISKRQTLSTFNIPENLKDIWQTQLTNTNKLSLKRLKKILIDYHKRNKINYDLYFNKPKSISNLEIGLAFDISKVNLSISNNEQIDLKSSAPGIFASCRFYFPRLIKNSFISSGLGISKYNFHNNKQVKQDNQYSFYETDIQLLHIYSQNTFNKKILNKANLDIHARLGFELYYKFGDDGKIVIEHQNNNIIRTENDIVKLSNNFGINPIIGFVADRSILNQDFSFYVMLKYYLENASSSPENPELEFNNAAISFGLSMKF